MNRAVVEIKLKKKEREHLIQLTRRGAGKARVLTRARVLLLSDEGKSPSYITESLYIKSLRTVQNIKERYKSGGLEEALYDRPPGKF